jgi:hypothetical protein
MPRSTRKTRKLPKSRTPIKKKITKKKQCGGVLKGFFKKKKKTYDSCTPRLLHTEKLSFNSTEDNNKLIDSIVKELKNSPAYLAQKCGTYITADISNNTSEIAYVYIHYNKKPHSVSPYVELKFFANMIGNQNPDCEPFHIKTIDDSQTNEPNDNVQTYTSRHLSPKPKNNVFAGFFTQPYNSNPKFEGSEERGGEL